MGFVPGGHTGKGASICLRIFFEALCLHQTVNFRNLSEPPRVVSLCHRCLEMAVGPTPNQVLRRREKGEGLCSGRSHKSLVVQEEKPSCKDRVGR